MLQGSNLLAIKMDVRSLHFCPAVLPNLFDVEICLQSRSVSQDISLGNVAIFRVEEEEEEQITRV